METTPTTQDANPYRLLQLHDGAPRTLVDETYWLLVNRAHREQYSDDRERRIYLQKLNHAYETITRTSQPVAFSPLPLPEKRWFPMKKRAAAPPPDPYKLLSVSPDADGEVVTHAAKIMAVLVPQGVPKDRWVRMLSDAATQITRTAPATSKTAEHGEPSHATEPETMVDGPMSAASPIAEAGAPEGSFGNIPQSEDPATALLQPSRSGACQLDLSTVVGGALTPNARESGAQQGGLSRNSDRDARVAQRETESKRSSSWVPFLSLVFDRRARQTQLFDERDIRLLQLRDSQRLHIEATAVGTGQAGESTNLEPDSTEEPAAMWPRGVEGSAHVLHLDEIARRGHEHTFGSGLTAARLQIWKQGSRYLMQQLDGSPLSVNGAALTSPLIVLEDGDELTHDGEKLTLRMS